MPFEADTAGSRFKKVLRDALRVFPTKNPAALREAMQNDSSSEEGSDDDDDGFSDAGEEMALLADLGGNRSGDGALARVALALGAHCPRLRTLSLASCGMCDGGAGALGRAFRCHADLEVLDVSGSRITSAGCLALSALLRGAGSAEPAGRGPRDGGVVSLNANWNLLGDDGAVACAVAGVAAPTCAPPVGRTVAPSPLHTLRLENCCGAGHEHALLEAVHTVVAFLSRLNRSAPSIVVEFPDRHRTVVRDCEYGDDELTFLSGARPRLGSDDLSIATSPSMDELTGGPTAPVADRADDADDGSLADASLGGASAKTLSTHASWLSREGDRRKARRRPFSRMLEIPADALSNQKFAPPAPQNEHGRGSMTAAGRRSLRDGPGRGSLQGAPGGRASMQRGSLNGGGNRGSLNAGGASRGSLNSGGGRASLQRLQSGLQRGSLKQASAAMAALGGLQIGRQSKTWSRRKDETSYFNIEALDRLAAADFTFLVAHGALRDELAAKRVLLPSDDRSPPKPPKGGRRRTDRRAPQSDGSRSSVILKKPVSPGLARLEDVFAKHHAALCRVFRFFSAAFSPDPRLPIVRLHRFAFLELLEALGLVDRRRVASNVAAVDFAFDRPLARLLRDDLSAPAPEAKAAPQPADRPRLPPATGPARRRRSSNLTPAMLLGLDAPAAPTPRAGGGGDRGVLFPKVLASVLEGAFARLHKARPRALLDPDTFRRHALYSPEVDVALKPHARPLSELYSAYKDGPDHASVLMGVDGWLRLLHGAGLLRGDARPRHDLPRDDDDDQGPGKPRFTDRPERPYEGDLTEADARCCFAYAQVQTGGDDGGKEKGRRKNTDEFITRIDFVEALCWLALMKPLPSARALTHAWEPGTSLEDFVEVLDEPDVINSPDLHHFIDMPKPLPQTPRDAAWLSLESLVIKMLFVVYRRVARANPALERVCLSIGQPACERQLGPVAAGLG
ncbi:hypothetical protein JL721_10021 [Aureococcus anophagefferens]|nr:hypothetical protein JL721_10021 [Aureococcus anophagefferens]